MRIGIKFLILIIGGSGSSKTKKSLFNLVNQQPYIDNIYLHAKDSYEVKYQLLINKGNTMGTKHLKDLEAFIEYLNHIDDIYKNMEEYKSNKKRNIFILFDRITGMLSNKKRNELFVRAIKLNISLVFITQFYFPAPKNIRLNYIQGFSLKIPNEREL